VARILDDQTLVLNVGRAAGVAQGMVFCVYATVEDVALLREIAPESVGVKAAGGIRDLERMREMLNAGARRIGASATEAIAAELGVGD